MKNLSTGSSVLFAKEPGTAILELIIKAFGRIVNAGGLVVLKCPPVGLRNFGSTGFSAYRAFQFHFPAITSGHGFLRLEADHAPTHRATQDTCRHSDGGL
ncbi:hypothetical protein BAE36_25045 [Rhizobium leguminosarum bv. trifolii]|uniref:Uncharacterized protein n=1 Tax=Rhizobium leguminosarum bv. trifolii TaxID=386 RepID=A0A1B8R6M2_RHILT|nr:hypothetical protein [Rhizobium leguminosarum bv. trifolii]OBY04479.1 hypothetical protein BAE36_25045 [Rhizobium leguminosarum bv. trifolii]